MSPRCRQGSVLAINPSHCDVGFTASEGFFRFRSLFFFYIDSSVVSLVGIRVPGSWERQATGIMLDDGRRRAIAYLSAH
jgi:hypothetical protein